MTSDCSSSTLLSIDLSSWYEVPWAAGSSRLIRASRGCRGAQPSPCGAQPRGRRPAWKPVAIATRQPNQSNQADAIAHLARTMQVSLISAAVGRKRGSSELKRLGLRAPRQGHLDSVSRVDLSFTFLDAATRQPVTLDAKY